MIAPTVNEARRSSPRPTRARGAWGASAALALLVGTPFFMPPREARACGCFAPPDPSVPVLQAGERIVFSHRDGVVTAHVQIQYQGDGEQFAWLLPLPSAPTRELQLGVEELFTTLTAVTQPKYRLVRVAGASCEWTNLSANAANDSAGPTRGPGQSEDGDVLAFQASVGPYDYAVLHADRREEMLRWLDDNGYFVPAGTQDVVGPYINPGAYFLALKLRKGNDVGDLQPVVVQYASDLPMIPIILTSVAANPDMGIQVWVLGEHRAIPRNYRHAVLNEELIDWYSAGSNYNEVVLAALNEADGGHAFVTEYAGSTAPMVGRLDPPNRFGERARFEAATLAETYAELLAQGNFPLSSTYIATLRDAFPIPPRLAATGVDEETFYGQLSNFLGYDRFSRPELYEGSTFEFDPVALTAELWERIVIPTLEAGRLFRDAPKMTRLYSALSPEEMTIDPVFSFNPDLPDQSNVHEATLTYVCSFDQDGPSNTRGVLELPDGRRFRVRNDAAWGQRDTDGIAFAARIELLREEGPPEVEVDNTARMSPGVDDSGCACSARSGPVEDGRLGTLALLLLLLGARARRR